MSLLFNGPKPSFSPRSLRPPRVSRFLRAFLSPLGVSRGYASHHFAAELEIPRAESRRAAILREFDGKIARRVGLQSGSGNQRPSPGAETPVTAESAPNLLFGTFGRGPNSPIGVSKPPADPLHSIFPPVFVTERSALRRYIFETVDRLGVPIFGIREFVAIGGRIATERR